MSSDQATPSPLRHHFFRNPVEETEGDTRPFRLNMDAQNEQDFVEPSGTGRFEDPKQQLRRQFDGQYVSQLFPDTCIPYPVKYLGPTITFRFPRDQP